ELLLGTSRFLSQPTFIVYKAVLGGYYLFWAVYWPKVEGFSKQAVHQLTFWTWDACAGYFVVSTATAFLCWRAMKDGLGSAAPSAQSSPGMGTTVSHVHVGRGNHGEDEPAAPVHGCFEAPSGLAPRCSWPLSWRLRWLQLILWNIACVASLLVALVWASGDYLEQVQRGVKNFDVQAHGLIAFFMLVDQFLSGNEFKLKHVIIAQAYGVIYLVFSILWFYTAPEAEKYLYEEFLDWENNRVNACITGAAAIGVLAPLAASVHFFVYRYRYKRSR
ncbi:unnamed protein product, partial [Scytosiphon promiscuus]